MLVKELVLVDTHAHTRVADLRIRSLPYLRADIAMYDLLKLFQTGRSHMVVLTKPPQPTPPGGITRVSSQEVEVKIEEAKDRVSPSVRQRAFCFWILNLEYERVQHAEHQQTNVY